MASSSKKKTTMAKYAREAKLRERRANKQAKKDARKLASSEDPAAAEGYPDASAEAHTDSADQDSAAADAQPAEGQDEPEPLEAVAEDDGALQPEADADQSAASAQDAGAKDSSLRRLRDASDAELELFEDRLRQDALAEGATELELRQAQSGRPGHG